MGLEKTIITALKQCAKYTKACGKSSILETRHIHIPSIEGLKYAPKLTEDVVQFSSHVKPIETISHLESKEAKNLLDNFTPTVSKNSAVSMHHQINSKNSQIREAIKCRAEYPADLNKNGIEEYLSKTDEHFAKFSQAEKEAIISDEIFVIEDAEKYVAKVDKEFAKLPPLEKDCIVYRGRCENAILERLNSDFEIMEKAKVGDVVIPDTGYSYTAFHYDMANHWGNAGRTTGWNNEPMRTIMYEIRLPNGAKVSRNLEHGGEVVMPRGAQYKVVDKKVHDNGDIEAVLEYILPKSN